MNNANCAPVVALADTAPFPVAQWIDAVYRHPSRPTAGQRDVLVSLAVTFVVPDTGEGLASITQLAEFCGAGRPTVQRAFRWAKRSGLLVQTRRGHRLGNGEAVNSRWQLILGGHVAADETFAEAAPASVHPVRTALYRWYDETDRLLYVGISDVLTGRVGDHVRGSSWMDFAVRSTIERYPSRKEAAAAETEAIKGECPIFNCTHNSTPEARARLVEYLLERGRVDLLVPAVARG